MLRVSDSCKGEKPVRVSEAVADALAAEANGPIFGLMGDANMAVWGALGKDPRVRMVATRYDGAAVSMADGYARASGKVGLATVTCGPGLANCGNALITASRAQSPLVVFTGEYLPGGTGAIQALDQRQFARACEAGFQPLAKLDSLAEDISEGFYFARTRQCPVILNLPFEHWEAELAWPWEYHLASEFIPSLVHAPREDVLAQAVEQIMTAKRPVIIAGRGAMLANAKKEIERLGDRIGALLATSLIAKGFFDGNPYDVGISGSFSSGPTEKLMADADLVLGIGASLNFYTTEGGMLFPNARIVRIDVKPFHPEIGISPGLFIQGDARATTLALARALEAKGVSMEGYRSAPTRAVLAAPAAQEPHPTDGLDPRELMRVLSHSLPSNTQVIVGGGHFLAWPTAYLSLPEGGRYQHTNSFGSIGMGLAHGIGAALGCPDRTTLIVEGDGGLLMGIQEFHAAAEKKLSIIVLVMNDSGYGAEVHKLRWKGQDPRDAMWQSPDFVAIARAFGGEGVRIHEESELAEAVARALKYKGPFLIDARVSPSMISDSYAKVFLGKENHAPLLRPVG